MARSTNGGRVTKPTKGSNRNKIACQACRQRKVSPHDREVIQNANAQAEKVYTPDIGSEVQRASSLFGKARWNSNKSKVKFTHEARDP